MELIIQPKDGLTPLIVAIKKATKQIDITIFRFDLKELQRALESAVTRGVKVHALIAHTSGGGEKRLRKLELELLAAGVTVSRTDDDLLRYHNKMMMVDGETLYTLGFNFARLDVEKSRSMGVATKNKSIVAEALKLFERGLVDFREIPIERLQVAALDEHLRRAPKDDGPEPVPLGLVEELAGGNLLGDPGQHGLDGRGDGKNLHGLAVRFRVNGSWFQVLVQGSPVTLARTLNRNPEPRNP